MEGFAYADLFAVQRSGNSKPPIQSVLTDEKLDFETEERIQKGFFQFISSLIPFILFSHFKKKKNNFFLKNK